MSYKDSENALKGAALQALRLKAGFGSSAAAAQHFGWSPSSYKSHESGVRAISDEQAQDYASAYGVKARDILDPNPDEIAKWRNRAEGELETLRSRVAERLVCARILAGYPTPSAAARSAKIPVSTYQKHENGTSGLAPAALALYSELYGVRVDWLASGELPSGLGTGIDRRLSEVLKNPIAFIAQRADRPISDHERIEVLKDSLGPGRPGVSAQSIFEYDWEGAEKARGRLEKLPRRAWTLPASFFTDEGIDHRNLFILVRKAFYPGDGVERIFVCKNFGGVTDEGVLAYDGRELSIRRSGKHGRVLGSVIWRMRSPSKVRKRT